jgi:hypothetical protein
MSLMSRSSAAGGTHMKRTDRFIRDCKSWDDFFERNKLVPTRKEQGDNFERLVQLKISFLRAGSARNAALKPTSSAMAATIW